MASGGPPGQRCSFGGDRPVVRQRLILPTPTPACHRLSTTAPPWTLEIGPSGPSAAFRTAPRASVLGVAVRSGRDPGPASHPGDADSARPDPHSHGGGRGRGRHGGSGREGARGRGMGQGRWRGGAGGGRGAGAPTSAHSGRGRGRSPDLYSLEHLGQLQEVVEQWAEEWTFTRNYNEFARAFNRTCKVRYRATVSGHTLADFLQSRALLGPCMSSVHVSLPPTLQ